ncbi:GAF and ANTAR domain-containing protein [Leifsonia sp. YAF41]|uniref:GAF and ANTAR domain-containing protein n=1 Tax=Leifsonia sp. YAF41 TaxID=3233086 RepID=UPI003F9C4E57
MSERNAMAVATGELSNAFERRTSLCHPFLAVLPIDGAAISMLGAPFGIETVCATNPQAARVDELQIDLGEGPSWDAFSRRAPVFASDLTQPGRSAWPMLLAALSADAVGALYAFPLAVGSLEIGAVELYAESPGELTSAQVNDAIALADLAAVQLLKRAMASHELDAQFVPGEKEYSRRVEHQATGMVLAQLNVTAADAHIIIRAHAFAHGRSVRETANAIVERRLDLSSPNTEF